MNVAHSATAHTAKAGSATGAHHARGKGQASPGDTGGANGFLSLFSALESDADTAGIGKDADGSASLAGAGLMADGSLAANGFAALDALALPGQTNAAANVALVGDGEQGAQAASVTAATGAAITALVPGQDARTTAALVVGSADAVVPAGQAADAGGAGAAGTGAAQPGVLAEQPKGHGVAQGASEVLKALEAQIASTDAGGNAQASTLAQAAGADASDTKGKGTVTALPTAAKPSEVQLADSKLAAELRMVDISRQLDSAALKAPDAQMLLLAASADGTLREVQRASERTAGSTASAGLDGGPGQPFAVTAGAATDNKPSASVDAASLTAPEVQVAEQVSYWVSRDVRNAELKLDGLGGNPVEVSISLVGHEAHVEFRTDQPEIRQVLENAMPHLKDMLQSEGLTLTGTTVGTSGQGGQAGQEQKSRGDMRQAKMALASLAPAQNGRRMDATMGSTVDYFV